MTTVVVLAAFAFLLLSRVPVAFVLAAVGLGMIWFGDLSPMIVPQSLRSALDSFTLLAVPLFILMANVLLKGGAGGLLFGAVQTWVGHWPGGLAVATIISNALFSAISGTSIATTATISVVALPEMISRGYPRRYCYGVLAAGGTLGILIPPSIPLLIYGVLTEQSITDLFLAGIGPGLMLVLLFSAYAVLHAMVAGQWQPTARAGWGERLRSTIKALPLMAIAVIVISGIYTGFFTPTEAAAVGLVASLILTVAVHRSVGRDEIRQALLDTASTTVAIFVIIAGAHIFAVALTLYRIPQEISSIVIGNVDSAWVFIILISLLLLLLGFFLESVSLQLIMVPILYPSLAALGIDPIVFAILFVLLVECGLITPPVGLNLYILQSISRDSIVEISAGVLPYVIIMLISIGIVYAIPEIALFIPFQL